MPRATFLVVEPEPSGALSTRKLVLETAKYNVITAHSGKEGLKMFERFPDVDAVVVHAALEDISCLKLVQQVKKKNPAVPVVALAPNAGFRCGPADHVVSSHDPQALLRLLQDLVGRAV